MTLQFPLRGHQSIPRFELINQKIKGIENKIFHLDILSQKSNYFVRPG